MILEPGTMVSERIRLERLLGEGGMGSVWIADHLTLGTKVAVKFVTPELAASHPELRDRFLREAAAAAKITSPHVVRTFDFGSMSDGTPYLIMELLEGESLGDRLKREKALPPIDAGVIISQVAKALAEAHRLGVIHRDIKPGNVFLTRAGRDVFAKVLDFGIAKDVETVGSSAATKTGFMLGTPQYMSPEQLLSAKGVDAHADMWALAVTAYESIVGMPPFMGETVPHLIVSIHGRQFEAPSSIRHAPVVGDKAALDAFFKKAFAEKKEHRFDSILDLADAFSAACGAQAEAPASRAQRTVYGAPMESEEQAAPTKLAVETPVSAPAPQPEKRTIEAAPIPVEKPQPTKEPSTEPGAEPGGRSGHTQISRTRLPDEDALDIKSNPSKRAATQKSSAPLYAAVAGGIGVVALVGWIATRNKASGEEPAAGPTNQTSTTTSTTRPVASTAPAPAPAPTVSASASAQAAAPFGTIPAGLYKGDPRYAAWMPAFQLKSLDTPVSSLPKAFAACQKTDSLPCNESQWLAACDADPALGSKPVWIASADNGVAVVRGGKTCEDRSTHTAGADSYGVACCDLATGATGKLDAADQEKTARHLTNYAIANNARDPDKTATFYADNVNFLGNDYSRAALKNAAGSFFQGTPNHAQVYGRCAITMTTNGWRSACRMILYGKNTARDLTQTLVWNAADKLVSVSEEGVQEIR